MSPLFPEPERVAKQLSAMYSGPDYRASPRGRPTYVSIKALKLPTCDECFANQHETHGASGPRGEARVRRTLRPGLNLNLCRLHENLWRDRDQEDLPPK